LAWALLGCKARFEPNRNYGNGQCITLGYESNDAAANGHNVRQCIVVYCSLNFSTCGGLQRASWGTAIVPVLPMYLQQTFSNLFQIFFATVSIFFNPFPALKHIPFK
jgi:hypothetical protein